MRHRTLVTLNTTADLDGPGAGKRYLVYCPTCVRASTYAASKAGEVWRGAGERYVDDYRVALDLAAGHERDTAA